MALINRLGNNYDETQGIAPGLGSIAATMRAVPAIRAQAAMRQAQTGHYGAMANAENARAELYKQQGLKTEDERRGADEIATVLSQPGAVTKDSMGNVIISAPAFQSMLGSLARASKGAADFGSGFKNVVTTENAPTQEQTNRQSKESIAAGQNTSRESIAASKPIVAPAGASIYERTPAGPDNNPSPSEVDNPDYRAGDVMNPVAARLIATAPAKPSALRDYTTTSIADVRNPAYDPASGMTNVPPMIKRTNTTSRVVGSALPANNPPQQQQAQPATVRVKHPNGQTGTIPASQLDEALKLGYTQIQ